MNREVGFAMLPKTNVMWIVDEAVADMKLPFMHMTCIDTLGGYVRTPTNSNTP